MYLFIAVGIMSSRLYINWKNDPVVTTIGNAFLPITMLDFPAITICSPGNDLEDFYKIHQILLDDWNVRKQEDMRHQ